VGWIWLFEVSYFTRRKAKGENWSPTVPIIGKGLAAFDVEVADISKDVPSLDDELGCDAPSQGQLEFHFFGGEGRFALLAGIGTEAVVIVLEVLVVFRLDVQGQGIDLALADFEIGDGEGEDIPPLSFAGVEKDEIERLPLSEKIDHFCLAAVTNADVRVVHQDREWGEGFVTDRRVNPVRIIVGGGGSEKRHGAHQECT